MRFCLCKLREKIDSVANAWAEVVVLVGHHGFGTVQYSTSTDNSVRATGNSVATAAGASVAGGRSIGHDGFASVLLLVHTVQYSTVHPQERQVFLTLVEALFKASFLFLALFRPLMILSDEISYRPLILHTLEGHLLKMRV